MTAELMTLANRVKGLAFNIAHVRLLTRFVAGPEECFAWAGEAEKIGEALIALAGRCALQAAQAQPVPDALVRDVTKATDAQNANGADSKQ